MIDPRGSSFKNFTIIDRYLENIQKKKKKYSSLERNFLNIFFHRSFRTFPFESLLNFDLDSRESFQFFFLFNHQNASNIQIIPIQVQIS